MGIWPDANEGLGPKSIDQNQLMGVHSDGFAKPEIDLSSRGGKFVKYDLPDAIMDSGGPYEIPIPSTGTDYLDMTTGRLYGEMKVLKIVAGAETVCDGADDFSLVNLPANSIFRQAELVVNGTGVADTSTSNYHYKAYLETQLR